MIITLGTIVLTVAQSYLALSAVIITSALVLPPTVNFVRSKIPTIKFPSLKLGKREKQTA